VVLGFGWGCWLGRCGCGCGGGLGGDAMVVGIVVIVGREAAEEFGEDAFVAHDFGEDWLGSWRGGVGGIVRERETENGF